MRLFFYRVFLSLSPKGGLGCGSGNSAALPCGSEATRPRQARLRAGARRLPVSCFNWLLCQASSLGCLPGGMGMDLHAAVPHGLSGGPSKPRPRGSPCECPLAWALPSHPSRGGSPRSIHPRVLGRMSPCPRFSLSASAFPLLWLREPTLLVHLRVAEVGRAGQSPHGDPTAASHPSSCLPQPRHHQPSHEGEWDVSPAAKPPTRRRVSQPFKHPKGLRQLGRSRSCRCFSLPGRAPAACESPPACTEPTGTGS